MKKNRQKKKASIQINRDKTEMLGRENKSPNCCF